MIRNALLIISSRTHHWVSLQAHCSPLWMLLRLVKPFYWTIPFILENKLSKSILLILSQMRFFTVDCISLCSDCLLSWQKDAFWTLLSASDNFSLNLGIPTSYESQLEAANALQQLPQLLALGICILSKIYIFGRE